MSNFKWQKNPKSHFLIISANIPAQPDWIFQRPYLTMDFVVDSEEPIDPVSNDL